jgi:hypothetical protein
MKHGALTPCGNCGFDPSEPEDKAKAMILTDHWLSEGHLEQIAALLRSGREPKYPEDALVKYEQMFTENPDLGPPFPKGLRKGCIVVMVVALIGSVLWLIAGRP